jgi:mono/diheme cytochrome c family protein
MNENQPQNFDHVDIDRIHSAVKREKPEPQPGQEPMPLWVMVCIAVILTFFGGYLGQSTANAGFAFNKTSPFGGAPVDTRGIEGGAGKALDPFEAAMKKGATLFGACQGCHMPTGLGQPGAIPPLAGSEWVLGGTERAVRIVLRGLMGPVTVKGANYNNVMPSQAALSDSEVAAVLTYVRNSWGNEKPMVTKEMVAKVRAEIESHPAPWTGADLEPFATKDCPGLIPAGPGATAAPAGAPPAAPTAAKK